MSKDEARGSASMAVPNGSTLETMDLDGEVLAIAERRLSQIVELLCLEPDSFRLAYEAALAESQGSKSRASSEQCLRVTQALSSIADPVLRTRLVQLFAASADDKTG